MELTLYKPGQNPEHWWNDLERFLIEDKEKIRQCFEYACKVHEKQYRKSGELFLSHPVWVAKVVAQLHIGSEAIMAALLHDCVEDGKNLKIDDLAKIFGDEVALLVEGLTEVRRKTKGLVIHKKDVRLYQRFLFSSVNDVRVLIIRLVDKLHNGMTIQYLTREQQEKYARRVLGIYAPVAEYVGLHFFKKRLEDIAFEIIYPKSAKRLKKLLKDNKTKELKAEESVKRTINKMLKVNRINDFEIQSRIKGLYSTYLKTKNKKYGEKRGYKDRVGIRVLLTNVADCYATLGLLHAKYSYLPEEFNDYISSPKNNGYRSLQTTLKWKKGLTVEVQIRTFEMHDFNEFGPASHIAYKYGQSKEGSGFEWVRDLVAWQNENGVKNFRIKVLTKYVYVFTPKGDTIQLPAGSTGLDFAYRIHSDVGNHCKGLKINGKIAKLDTVVKTGDLVEALTGKKINANRNWLKMVKSKDSREHIRKILVE